jgi:hypothetical protein
MLKVLFFLGLLMLLVRGITAGDPVAIAATGLLVLAGIYCMKSLCPWCYKMDIARPPVCQYCGRTKATGKVDTG